MARPDEGVRVVGAREGSGAQLAPAATAGSPSGGEEPRATSRDSALFLSAFFDELLACGVRDVVVSPGSRSTPLAMVAWKSEMRLFVDVDERGAAFFALGLAKAAGRPVCLVCTSGTAVANYYPAVMEASASRVPLLLLTADRPPRLWGLGAPQTTDQLGCFGSQVRSFRQMPLPSSSASLVAFARQAALEAWCSAMGGGPAAGTCLVNAGPVQLNFPFDNPLEPDLDAKGLFEVGRRSIEGMPVVEADTVLPFGQAADLLDLLRTCDTLFLAGESSARTDEEADELLCLAEALGAPVLADPLSGLRGRAGSCLITAYDEVLGTPERPRGSRPELVVRLGRWPVSKAAMTRALAPGARGERPTQLVVDAVDTRDFNAATDLFVRCDPPAFVRGMAGALRAGADREPALPQRSFLSAWRLADAAAAARLEARADEGGNEFEGAYVRSLLHMLPAGSMLWSASSMSVRAIDQFWRAGMAPGVSVLCNRGLNGIDGTLSSALGAAQEFAQSTLLVGDLAFLHDVNALHLQHELLGHHGGDAAPSLVAVLLNNQGGGIFDLLPQRSEQPWFERLFLTPQQVNFRAVAQAFGVPYRRAMSVAAFGLAYRELLGTPGVSLLEVPFSLAGTRERYRHV